MTGLFTQAHNFAAHWARIEKVAQRMSRRGDRLGHRWNPQCNLIGLAGEVVYRMHVGMPVEIDATVDGGEDVPGLNVKAVYAHFRKRILMLHQDKPRSPRLGYVLAAVNLDRREGELVGWATTQEMRSAPLQRFRGGQGPTHCIDDVDLRPIWSLPDALAEAGITS